MKWQGRERPATWEQQFPRYICIRHDDRMRHRSPLDNDSPPNPVSSRRPFYRCPPADLFKAVFVLPLDPEVDNACVYAKAGDTAWYNDVE